MGVGDIPKMQGRTQLSPHPKLRILRMPPPLRLYPTLNNPLLCADGIVSKIEH